MDGALKCVLETMKGQGRDISVYDESFLGVTLHKQREKSGAADAVSFCRLLKESRAEADAFADSLRVTYSCFFREPFSFALFEKLLPALIENKPVGSEIRIWSAGCADGQEAYSIAILMEEAIAAKGRGMRFRIFATDVSKETLKAAEAGAYGFEAVKDVRAGQLQKYFTLAGSIYRVAPVLKGNVGFSVYDLLDRKTAHPAESIFGGFDIVFCRNVLLYYNAGQRRFMMEKLAKSVEDGGTLVVGEAERPRPDRGTGRGLSLRGGLYENKKTRAIPIPLL